MQQDILIIEVLFPAIPLTMLNFGSRYTLLVKLIRHLHDKVISDNVSPTGAELFIIQIKRFRDRLQWFGITHSYAATTFVLAAMIAAHFRYLGVASWRFLASISLLMGPILLFTRKIQIANTAPDVCLSDFEAYQEWKQYMKPNRHGARKRNSQYQGTT